MTKDITNLMRKNIQKLKGYSCAKDEYAGEAAIFLDANENPFPRTQNTNRYPDPNQTKLRKKLSEFRGVEFENVICANGSDELIDQLIRIFCEPGEDSILICPPTFGMYEVSANLNDIAVEKISLVQKENDFELDVEGILKSKAKILFIPNPAAPTGGLFPREKLLEILEKFGGIVVIDEAYADFAQIGSGKEETMIPKIEKYPRLVVLQTFSKFWGLAGARVGVCFADEVIIEKIRTIKMPYSLNEHSQSLAIEAIDNFNYWKAKASVLVAERTMLETFLLDQKFVKTIFRSDANFIYLEVKEAQKCYDLCIKHGIIIRRFTGNFIRISIGLPEENLKLIGALKQC